MSDEDDKKKLKQKDLEDMTLVCVDCGSKFVFTAGEQKFFLDKGLKNMPKRCKPCTAKNKAKLREKKPMWWIKCVKCGKKSEVPFEPRSDIVYCDKCFNKAVEKRDKKIKALGEKVPPPAS